MFHPKFYIYYQGKGKAQVILKQSCRNIN